MESGQYVDVNPREKKASSEPRSVGTPQATVAAEPNSKHSMQKLKLGGEFSFLKT